MKDSFIFYRSYFEAIQDLKEKDRLKVYEAICELSLNGNEINLTGISNTIFKLIKPQIVANNERYENGRKGGRPKKTTGYEKEKPLVMELQKPMVIENGTFLKTKTKPNNNVNENVNVNENEIKEKEIKRKAFIKPTVSEIQNYCVERNNGINAEAFYDFYESKNWYVGKNKMIDWKACVRTWERRTNYKNESKGKMPAVDKVLKEIYDGTITIE